VRAAVARTASYDDYAPVDFGVIEVPAGVRILRVRPADPASWKPLNLRALTLRPE
jgi:hypothetical protein